MKGIFLDAVTIDHINMDMSGIDSVLSDLQINMVTSEDNILQQIHAKQVVISNKVNLDEKVLTAAKELKLVCIAASGMNNIDLSAAHDNKIVVCNVENYANESVAQHVFGLIINLLRNFPAYNVAIRNNEWHKSESFSLLSYNIESLSDKTLGIIGYGQLGKAVEKVAICFGMKVIVAERRDIPVNQIRAGRVPFEMVLEQSDIITLHCPLSSSTSNLISAAELKLMKSSSILINTARGGVVDELALYQAIKNGVISAAGIDVLKQEPPCSDSILLQENLTNLIVTPHIAWASKQSRQRLLDKVAQNIKYYITGEYKEQTNFYF